jgi:hypothetical protein
MASTGNPSGASGTKVVKRAVRALGMAYWRFREHDRLQHVNVPKNRKEQGSHCLLTKPFSNLRVSSIGFENLLPLVRRWAWMRQPRLCNWIIRLLMAQVYSFGWVGVTLATNHHKSTKDVTMDSGA